MWVHLSGLGCIGEGFADADVPLGSLWAACGEKSLEPAVFLLLLGKVQKYQELALSIIPQPRQPTEGVSSSASHVSPLFMEELGLVTVCVLKSGAKGQVQRCNPPAPGQSACSFLSPFHVAPR